jgi:hypothetical protein
MVKRLRLIAASLAVLLMASSQSLASDFQYATLSANVGGTKIPVQGIISGGHPIPW